MDERVVEYYWLLNELKKYRKITRCWVNNCFINLRKLLNNFVITIQTLYPENNNSFKHGVSYVYSDLLEKNFKDNYFDIITCISTLEHIGFDNKIYKTLNKLIKVKKLMYLEVIRNFRSYLKKNGVLFITLPFGKHQKFKDLQQFDKKMIDNIVKLLNQLDWKKFAIYRNSQ